MARKRKKNFFKTDRTRAAIFVDGKILLAKKTFEGWFLAEDGNVYVNHNGKFVLPGILNPVPENVGLGNIEVLGKFEYEHRGGDIYDWYQWQYKDGIIKKVLVQKGVKEISLGYVRNAGTKATTPGR